jgi:hypothetical protein
MREWIIERPEMALLRRREEITSLAHAALL